VKVFIEHENWCEISVSIDKWKKDFKIVITQGDLLPYYIFLAIMLIEDKQQFKFRFVMTPGHNDVLLSFWSSLIVIWVNIRSVLVGFFNKLKKL